MSYFHYGSSPVDWCEGNYEIHSSFAEFFNTISNIPFFILPAISIYLCRDYGKMVTSGVYVMFGLLMAVGAGSWYFHATLSLMGQLLDELLILWVLMCSYCMLFPENYLPDFFKNNRNYFNFCVFIFCMLITTLCGYNPYLNAYFLLSLSIPAFVVLHFKIKECHDKRALNLSKRVFYIWITTIAFWITDRTACSILIHMNLNYFHSIFHVLAIFSAQWTIALFLYFTAIDRVPHLKPTIVYWGEDVSKSLNNYNVFIPYVQFLTSKNLANLKDDTNIIEIVYKKS